MPIVTCEICHIKTSRIAGQKRHFMAKFPLDEDRCKQWVAATGNEDLLSVPIEKLHQLRYVCGKHFTHRDFSKKKAQLKKHAVPTKQISANPLPDHMFVNFPLHVAKDDANYYDHTYSKNTQEEDTIEEDEEEVQEYMNVISDDQMEWDVVELCSYSPPETPVLDQENIFWREKRIVRHKMNSIKYYISSVFETAVQTKRVQGKLLKHLITAAARNQYRKIRGKRWTILDKCIALTFYNQSPKTYRCIKKKLPMPSVRSLETKLRKVNMGPGIYYTVLDGMKRKARHLSAEDKMCVLVFGIMSIKKKLIYNVAADRVDGYVDNGEEEGRDEAIADRALVFMLQGLRKNFLQPIAHFFASGTISEHNIAHYIKNIVIAVRNAGYTIISTVCDHRPTNVKAFNLLKTYNRTVNNNVFMIDKEQISIVYDVPHLFTSIRDNFLEGGVLTMNMKKAKWAHIVELLELNRSTHMKNITKQHIEPKGRSKTKVKFAAQLLSNSVAAMLSLLADSVKHQEDKDEVLNSAETIRDLDMLFDCTNGPSSPYDVKKHIRDIVCNRSRHHTLWVKFKRRLNTLHLKSDSFLRLKNDRCVNCYIITIKSFQRIWMYMQEKNYKNLNLSRLNLKYLENLFIYIRKQTPTNRNPTCHHFHSALKSAILTRLCTPTSQRFYYETGNKLLYNFHDTMFLRHRRVRDVNVKTSMSYALNGVRYFRNFNSQMFVEADNDEKLEEYFKMFQSYPILQVGGYLANIISKDVNCPDCHKSISSSDPHNRFLQKWWGDQTTLPYPSDELCQMVEVGIQVFDQDVQQHLFHRGISRYFVLLMKTKCDITWICNNHRDLLSELLLRRLGHLLIRYNCHEKNKSFAI